MVSKKLLESVKKESPTTNTGGFKDFLLSETKDDLNLSPKEKKKRDAAIEKYNKSKANRTYSKKEAEPTKVYYDQDKMEESDSTKQKTNESVVTEGKGVRTDYAKDSDLVSVYNKANDKEEIAVDKKEVFTQKDKTKTKANKNDHQAAARERGKQIDAMLKAKAAKAKSDNKEAVTEAEDFLVKEQADMINRSIHYAEVYLHEHGIADRHSSDWDDVVAEKAKERLEIVIESGSNAEKWEKWNAQRDDSKDKKKVEKKKAEKKEDKLEEAGCADCDAKQKEDTDFTLGWKLRSQARGAPRDVASALNKKAADHQQKWNDKKASIKCDKCK